MKRLLFTLGILVIASPAFAVSIEGPRAGDAVAVAKDIIFNVAEQPCGKVISAKRGDKGIIIANCSNGEKYLVAIFKNAPMNDGSRKDVAVAMKCSIAMKMFGVACPN